METDPELTAMAAVIAAVTPLDDDARRRVMAWAWLRFVGTPPVDASEMARRAGKARAASMTPEERTEAARAAANARWKK